MTTSHPPPKGSVRLPHGAWLDKEKQTISVPLGNSLISFRVEEIGEVADILDDICTVVETNTKISVHVCESCGTEIEEMDYDEPKEGEWQ